MKNKKFTRYGLRKYQRGWLEELIKKARGGGVIAAVVIGAVVVGTIVDQVTCDGNCAPITCTGSPNDPPDCFFDTDGNGSYETPCVGAVCAPEKVGLVCDYKFLAYNCYCRTFFDNRTAQCAAACVKPD